MRNILIPLLLLPAFLSSCAIEPQPIEYGHDGCHFCKMTIVDQRYGAELVTAKGKVYKFDATECLIPYLGQNPQEEGALILVTDFARPGTLVAAQDCYFLRSPKLPSPMGKYLTAFATISDSALYNQKYPGAQYSWESLLSVFDGLPAISLSE